MSTGPLVTELDTTAKPASTAAAKATPEVKAVPETQPSQPQFTQADVETLTKLAEMGVNPQNLQEYVTAKQSLDRLPILLRDNPDLLLDEIEKNDPETHRNLLQRASDRWYERYLREHPEAAQDKQKGRASSTPVSDPRIDALERSIKNLTDAQTREATERQNAQIVAGYTRAVDDLLSKIPEEAALTDSEKDYIRMKTEQLTFKDNQARDRVSKGVYVDVPKHFKVAVERLTADKKQSASTETKRRSEIEQNGVKTVTPGAENVNGSAKQQEPNTDPIWGDITSSEINAAYSNR